MYTSGTTQCTSAARDQREAQETLAQKYHEMRETSETAAKESYDRGRDYQRNETERVLKDCRKREQACQELEGKIVFCPVTNIYYFLLFFPWSIFIFFFLDQIFIFLFFLAT